MDRIDTKIAAEVLAYGILGHHAGLPDLSNETAAYLNARTETYEERLDPPGRPNCH
jgi:hypothetical protein